MGYKIQGAGGVQGAGFLRVGSGRPAPVAGFWGLDLRIVGRVKVRVGVRFRVRVRARALG